MKRKDTQIKNNLKDLATLLRESDKKCTIIFAHNGTGKTRLSTSYKDLGKNVDDDLRDTLYFNAFTEDLFTWDNDLRNDVNRGLIFNASSHFFDGLNGGEISARIRHFLHSVVDFDFYIDDEAKRISFSRDVVCKNVVDDEEAETTERVENIKISRGEENIFIWCFFLAIAQMALDGDDNYKWVKRIYIDDPVSSLDDNNAIDIACQLARLVKSDHDKKIVISTHHGLFFNVLYNELQSADVYFLNKIKENKGYSLISMRDTPFFHHVVLIHTIKKAIDSDQLYTYHFNILRTLLDKTAAFFGYTDFKPLIKKDNDDVDGEIQIRRIQILNHGTYSLFNPVEMQDENKEHFKKIFSDFMTTYKFNMSLFAELDKE